MAEGRCTCGAVRYRLQDKPFAVHCCHCRDCQRETGSAFVINGLIETPHVEVIEGEPETILTPSASGKGQQVVRCPNCKVALWSHYGGMGEKAAFACTAAVEEVIDAHYAGQVTALEGKDEALRATVEEFRADEAAHRDTALENGAEQAPGYRLLSAAIRAGCRVAIKLSERI